MLRGYLNSSRHGVCCASGRVSGSSIVSGSTSNAHAIERRASSRRPLRISQRGDSGTQARITKVSNAGSKPTANSPRQPMTVRDRRPTPRRASRQPKRCWSPARRSSRALTRGTNSCTSGRSTTTRPAAPAPTKKRNTERKIQPPLSGVSAMMPVAIEKLSAVAINTLRRPILSAIQPQKKAPGMAPMPADSRIHADWP